MNRLLKTLLLGGSATALMTGAAMAQDSSALDIEEIQSSVSRIDLKGFEAPTPVTVVGIEQLNRDARVNIGDQIRELPQVRGGGSIQTGSSTGNLSQLNAGVDTIAIRGLSASRNLVLFDRQRVVPATLQEGTNGGSVVDVAMIPSGLTQRVDVVTGGASSAWGSDAVTGVINIVINKTFEGFKGNVSYANSTEVSQPVYKLSLAWGASFLGDKGHTVVGFDYTRNDDYVADGEVSQAHRDNGRGFVYNSAYCNAVSYPTATPAANGTCSSLSGQPLLVYAYGIGNTQNVVGGLAAGNTGGTAGSGLAANSLKGTMFVGEDSTPSQFNYGTIYNATSCYNGCTNDQNSGSGWGGNNPYHSSVFFNYTSYQILPDLKASVQLNYSTLKLRIAGSGSSVSGANRTVYADNPYLPDSVAQRFVCNGTASATCQTTLSNGYNPYSRQYETAIGGGAAPALSVAQRQARPTQQLSMGFDFSGNRQNSSPTSGQSFDSLSYDYDERCAAMNQNCGRYNKLLQRGVFTLEGVIGDSWTWSSYIQWGQSRVNEHIANPITIRLNNALDAVRVTSGNVGASGLAVGSIQCRGLLNISQAGAVVASGAALGVTTAGELAGCSPFNPFGTGEATNAAYNYVRPGANYAKTGSENFLQSKIDQTAAAFSMSGVLPWVLPAGEIGVAFGGEWRLESGCICQLDARSLLTMYPSGNIISTFSAHTHVEEGFVEIAVPILKDNIVQNLNIDVAGRMTNYSFSGLVETWKVGLQSQINDDVRLRMTWSYDIRAPNLWDLSSPGGISNISAPSFIIGPSGSNGGAPNNAQAIAGGNLALQPEKANTIAAGFVLTPTFIPGLTASVDWYQIHLHGAITTASLAQTVQRCQSGELVWCQQIVFERSGGFAAARGCGSLGIGNSCAGADTTSQISYVYTNPLNAGALNTAGFDFNVAYGFDLFTGNIDVSVNGNYVYDFSRTLLGVTFNGAGASGGYYSGGAKFSGTVNLDYREGAWSFGTAFRITGDSLMDLGTQGQAGIATQGVTYAVIGGQTVATVGAGQRDPVTGAETNYNAIVVRTDLRVQYRWSNNITFFGAIDNVQDLPTAGGILRRSYRMGVRFNY